MQSRQSVIDFQSEAGLLFVMCFNIRAPPKSFLLNLVSKCPDRLMRIQSISQGNFAMNSNQIKHNDTKNTSSSCCTIVTSVENGMIAI